ncbi:hypothetical protein BU23DRAFT_641594 [Bimuria novae-zelandiae CBS 107.79]|uniref:Uncharacterized protein n=1 Tax=Bimuria novae-zelandiae CBS 107.79 TaxID=1447943 RepID=A0A6A5V7K5_9PLEO|nr:hypothetical protein BU23DRAFT_641594 [Bimuria novae-zelandiae CBS 107.79]
MPHHILIHSKNKPSATTVAACAPRKRKAEKDAPSSNLSRQNKRVQCDNPCDSSAQHEYQPCMPMTRKRKAMAGCDSQIDPGSDDDGENAYARPCKNPKVAPEALAMMNDIKKHGIEAVQKKWSQHRMGETVIVLRSHCSTCIVANHYQTKQDKKRLAAKINRALIKSKAPLIRTPAWSFPSETGSFTASTETPQQKAERLAIEAETERKVTQAARMAEIKEAVSLHLI